MYYINRMPNESGNHGNPMGQPFAGCVELPEELLGDYLASKGFVVITVDGGTVTALRPNQEALDAYNAEHPDVPEPEPEPSADEILDALLGVSE